MPIHDVQPTPPPDEAVAYVPEEAAAAFAMIEDAVATIVRCIAPLATITKNSDDADRQGAWEALAGVLAVYRWHCEQLLDPLEEAIEGLLIQILKYQEHPEVEGLGTLIVHYGSKRKVFDNARTLSAFAARLADDLPIDRETGEVKPAAVLVEETCQELAKATGVLTPSFNGWRTRALQARKLNPSTFVMDETKSRLKVSIQPEKGNTP